MQSLQNSYSSNFARTRPILKLLALITATSFATIALSMTTNGSHAARPSSVAQNSCMNETVEQPEIDPVAEAGDALVMVGSSGGWGSGVIIHADGWLLTNYHVVETDVQDAAVTGSDATFQILRSQWDGRRIVTHHERMQATVWRVAPQQDLALLKISSVVAPLPFVELADTVQVGDPCIAFGSHASGLMWSVKPGHVSSMGLFPNDLTDNVYETLILNSSPASINDFMPLRPYAQILYTTCPISSGDSGGPLLNEDAQLIGLNFATPTNLSKGATGFHIALKEVRAFCEQLPNQPELAPFDLWTAGLIEADTNEPELLDIDYNNLADGLLRYNYEPHTGLEAITVFVEFDSTFTMRDQTRMPHPFGLWTTEHVGTFRFDLVVQLRSDGLIVIGATDETSHLTRIWIDRDGDGISEYEWSQDASQRWSRIDLSVVALEQLQIDDHQVRIIQRLLREARI